MSTPPGSVDSSDHTVPPDGDAPVPRRSAPTADGSGSGGTAVPTTAPPTTAPPTATTTSAGGQPGAPDQPGQGDPTAPLQNDSTGINSALGTSTGAAQAAPQVQQSDSTSRYLAHHQFSSNNEKDFYNFTEADYRHNQQFAAKADATDAYALLNDGFDTGVDGISENDRARIAAGVLDPAELAAATKAHSDNASDLLRYAQQISGGDTKAVSTADDVLAYGEPGLQFFKWFYGAYHLFTGSGEAIEQLEKSYHAEQGMSFADYVADAALLASISQGIDDEAWKVNNAATRLQSSWQGHAASNFGAKMQVLTTGANTVKQDLAVTGADISALVQGLEQLVIAKAEAVNQLFVAQLPDRIDGGIAYTFAKVAMGKGEDPERRVILGLLGMDMTGRHEFWAGDAGNDWSSGDSLNDDSRRAADEAAADWCNQVLVPEYEARQNALNTINAKTTQSIQKGFAEFTKQLQHIADPFAGMDSAGGTTPAGGAGGAGATGGGVPSGVSSSGLSAPHLPDASPTVPTGLSTPPQGSSTLAGQPGTGRPTGGTSGGTTRPAGLPPGARWIPSGVPLPTGWRQDPTTGEAVPKGWSVDPSTGPPTSSTSPTSPTSPVGRINPAQDIHHNRDGSVSLGRDRGLTISPEHGRKGVFTLRDTGADGIEHTYRVHFDDHGRPVVTEQAPHDQPGSGPNTGELTGPGDTVPQHLTGSGTGGGGVAGVGGFGGVSTGATGVPSGSAAAPDGGTQLADGTHVGADNTTTSAMNGPDPAPAASPVAGSAAEGQGHREQGGFGGVPFGGGGARGAGGQEQESARRYPQRGDVVGEEELEQWQRMGPVIGEQ